MAVKSKLSILLIMAWFCSNNTDGLTKLIHSQYIIQTQTPLINTTYMYISHSA